MLLVREIVRASKEYKYIAIRTYGGVLIPINTKFVGASLRKYKPKMDDITDYYGYIPLSLNEYISMKIPNSFAKN